MVASQNSIVCCAGVDILPYFDRIRVENYSKDKKNVEGYSEGKKMHDLWFLVWSLVKEITSVNCISKVSAK